MTNAFFGISAAGTLSGLVNVETLAGFAPSALPEFLTSLTGKVKRRTSAGTGRADGFLDSILAFDVMRWSDYRTFMQTVFGGFTTPSKAVALTLLTEDNYYSPFTGKIEKPTFTLVNDYWIRDVRFPLSALVLQAATKTGNFTVTTSTRLLYADTSGGSITFALPALAGVTANTVYSFQKVSASNSLVLNPDGSETIEGASTYTLTANYARVDIYSDGSEWKVI